MKRIILIGIAIFSIALISCEEFLGSGIVSKNPEGGVIRTPDWNQINQEFGLSAFNKLIAGNPDSNVVISPLSIEFALSMTSNGAANTTLEEMMQALKQDRLTRSQVNTHFLNLMNDYNSRNEVALNIANSIWMREQFPFNPSFLETNQTFYHASTRSLDFDSPSAKDTINQWVDDRTQGRIPTIIDRISPNAVMFLINAIYFKGDWLSQFDSISNSKGPFYFSDGHTEEREYMFQMEPFKFIKEEEFIAVSLPFKDSTMGMSFFLPAESVNINLFVENITLEKWEDWNAQLDYNNTDNRTSPPYTEVLLHLPKFEVEYEEELKPLLIDMGMEKAFLENAADFSNMTDAPVFLSNVKHKTFLQIDEAGAEAAAVTSVGVEVTSLPPIVEAKFNRPFVVILHDYVRGNILFIGKIEDPVQP